MLSDRGTAVFLFFLFFSLFLIGNPVFIFILLIAVFPALFVPKMRQNAILLLFIGALIIGSFSIRTLQTQHLSNLVGSPVIASGILHDIRREDRFSSGTLLFATLRSYRGQLLTLPRTLRFTLSGTALPSGLTPGSTVTVTGRLRKHQVYRNTGT
ncbi:MAG: hypothetical protein GXO70_03260, partial [Acidobacteria bacterium]|nr:hypothetical protein [Acidobacteriota bacterium]